MQSGRFAMRGTVITLRGSARTATDYALLLETAADGPPQGAVLAMAEIEAPRASPFVWSAEKDSSGAISLSGYVPSEAVRGSLMTAINTPGADAMTFASGQPAGFEASALSGLAVLDRLDTGSISFDGTNWSLSGAVDTAQESFAAESAFVATGLAAAGWSFEVKLPEPEVAEVPPPVESFTWSVEKIPNGAITFNGYAPTEQFKRYFETRADGIVFDNTAIADGAPETFVADAMAGFDALQQLAEGRLSFAGGKWSLEGKAADATERDIVLAILNSGVEAEGWQIDISAPGAVALNEPQSAGEPAVEPEPSPEPEAEPETPVPDSTDQPEPSVEPEAEPQPEPEPEVTVSEPEPEPKPEPEPEVEVAAVPDYDFTATRTDGAPIVLSGDIPAEAMAKYFGVIAGNVPIDGLVPAEGAPEDFLPNATAGLTALEQMTEGTLTLSKGKWSLVGQVMTEDQRVAALAPVETLPNANDWSTDVSLPPAIDVCRASVAAFAERNAILFQSGSALITEASEPALDELAADLFVCPEATVHIEGHTDADGPEDLNLALSVARAEAVVEALISRGIAMERLYAIGYGESLPIAPNDTTDGKRLNRRIVFTIVEEST
jgi:outer membrane protein OmpA-like peptidoglycan-associated protein